MYKQSSRIFGLDLIRAFAIFLVILSHSTYLLFPVNENSIVSFIRVLGAVGVDLFFVLSGFLIGGILLKYAELGKSKFSDLILFWKRRWLRTLPNYFLVLCFNMLLFFYFSDTLPDKVEYYFVFIQNFNSMHPDFFTEAWSLSIEEYAYLLVPLLFYLAMFFLKSKDRKQLFLWTTLLSIGVLILLKLNYYFTANIDSYVSWSSSFRKVVIFRVDSIYLGFLVVYFRNKYQDIVTNLKNKFALVGIMMFGFVHILIYMFHILPETHLFFYVFIYLQIIGISLGLMFPYFIGLDFNSGLSKTIGYISKRSYAIYLINYSIVFLSIKYYFSLTELAFSSKMLLLIVFLASTLVLSEMVYRYFEQPILKFRNRKFSD